MGQNPVLTHNRPAAISHFLSLHTAAHRGTTKQPETSDTALLSMATPARWGLVLGASFLLVAFCGAAELNDDFANNLLTDLAPYVPSQAPKDKSSPCYF